MSKKANPAIVGTFVLVAIALTVIAIITLGNISFKDDKFRCVAFFTGSLYGLDIGAPVTFRGIIIGRVSEIRIMYDKEQNNYIIPVSIEIEQTTSLGDDQDQSRNKATISHLLQQMIDRGLRAQLKVSSLLTGKLYIDLAFYPESEVRLRGASPGLLEIPTKASGLEEITQKLESLPLSEILNKVATALDGITNLINAPETRQTLQSLDTALARINTLVGHADAELPGLVADFKKGLTNFSTLSSSARTFLQTADKELPPMSRELQHMLASLNTTALALTKTMQHIEQLTAKDSTLTYQVDRSLHEIEKAATSIRQLTDYLQQNPNALIFGQKEDRP